MPDASDILATATSIARDHIAIAIAWHVAIAVALVALARGWRPARRTAYVLLAVPLASVALISFHAGSPFNGGMLAIAASSVVGLAANVRHHVPVARRSPAAVLIGLAMIAFAWFYPHFLRDPLEYAIASPVGLLPCPTLAAVMGFVLLGVPGRGLRLVLAGFGLFYGLFGVVRLGVGLDAWLIAGAVALATSTLRVHAPVPDPTI